MKKENIYVEITNKQERLRAIEILQNAGECFDFTLRTSIIFVRYKNGRFYDFNYRSENFDLTKITLDELEALLNPKKSNVFTEVQELIKQHFPDKELIVSNTNDDCLRRLEQHLIDHYPKGTKVKISKDKIEIYHS